VEVSEGFRSLRKWRLHVTDYLTIYKETLPIR
jgi:hypothetical protein